MTLKDVREVFTGIDVSIYREIIDAETRDVTFDKLYSGRISKMPSMLDSLKVESAEPTSVGLNIDIEPMIIGEVKA